MSKTKMTRDDAIKGWADQQKRIIELETLLLKQRTSSNSQRELEVSSNPTVEHLEREVIRLQASEDLRFRELATLAKMINANAILPSDMPKSELANIVRERADVQSSSSTREAALMEQLRIAKRERRDLLNSTSWKITAPLRHLVTMIRG